MSADPAGFGLINPMGSDGKPRSGYSLIEGTNWYSYVSNNPVRYVDPTGMAGQRDDAQKEGTQKALSGIPSMLIDSVGNAGIAGTMLSLVTEADTIAAAVLVTKGDVMRDEAVLEYMDAGSRLNTPEGTWNSEIAEFKMATGEYLIDVANMLLEGEAPESLPSTKETLDIAREQLEQFLYDPKRNPYFEEGKTYTIDDLEYKPLPDE